MRDDFAVFILSHGRADHVITAKTLKKQGYTGKWYIVIDNEDEQENRYRELYGDKVLQFDKKAVAEKFDTMDTQKDRRTIVYARNACFDLARKIGVRYFLELDDDYTIFMHRFKDQRGKKLLGKTENNLDAVFSAMLDFLIESGAHTVAFAQGGDFIGGAKSGTYDKKILRKAMNTFFCDVEKPFQFIGRINEDVNTYTRLGSVGWLGMNVTDFAITQKQTQSNKGGMSGVYLDSGTYLKSFYTVMCMPSAVKIHEMGDKNRRIHHSVSWENCVPMILNQFSKKSVYESAEWIVLFVVLGGSIEGGENLGKTAKGN